MNANQTNMDRRNFLGAAGLFTAGLLLNPKNMFSQAKAAGPIEIITQAAATARINVTRLRDNIYMVEGSGGNIAVLNGPEGKLLVDAGINVSRSHMQAALNTISNKPIKLLINSHWHFDHTSGNDWLHKAGATIISQDITRDHLSKNIYQADWAYTFKALPKAGIPTVIYKSEYTKQFNGEKIIVNTYLCIYFQCYQT